MNHLLLSASSSFPTDEHLCLQFGEFLLVHDSFFHLVGAEMGPWGKWGTRVGTQVVSGRPAEVRRTHAGPPSSCHLASPRDLQPLKTKQLPVELCAKCHKPTPCCKSLTQWHCSSIHPVVYFFFIYVRFQLHHAASFTGAHTLQLWHTGLLAPWDSMTQRILVPPLGIKPASPALQGGFLTTGPPGNSLFVLFLRMLLVCPSLSGDKSKVAFSNYTLHSQTESWVKGGEVIFWSLDEIFT